MNTSAPINRCRQAGITARLAVCIVLALSVAACTTVDYTAVQKDFNHAVELDNGAALSGNPFEQADYAAIVERLTDERIAALDPRLQANAWLLRAFSEYRLDRLDANAGALRSQSRGLRAEPAAGSRDDILLRLIPALVLDRELELDWLAKNKQLTSAQYHPPERSGLRISAHDYASDFKLALDAVDRAMQAINAATPVSVKYYAHYHKWRILENWRAVIVSLQADSDTDSDDLRFDELERAQKLLSKPLEQARDEQRDAIPTSHALRALINVKGGG